MREEDFDWVLEKIKEIFGIEWDNSDDEDEEEEVITDGIDF